MKNKQNENLAIISLSILSMCFLIYIGNAVLQSAKIDFTQESLYSLSPGTENILGKLNTPIKLKLYYSKTAANKGTEGLRRFNNYYLYVKNILKEFESRSRNNITLEVIDPRPDTDEEEDAKAFGLKKFHLTETEIYYFGLVAINESGSEKVIEFFDPAEKENLEYELTKLVYSSVNPKKPTIGVLSSQKVFAGDISPYMAQIMRMQGKPVEQSWAVVTQAQEFFTIKDINKEDPILAGVDILLVVHPKGFADKQLYAIDQFILRGGKVFMAVDPFFTQDQANQMAMMGGGPQIGIDDNIVAFMNHFGIETKAKSLAGDRFISGVGRVNPNLPPSRLLPLIQCDERCTENYKDPMAKGLNQMTFVFPGGLKIKEKNEGNTFEVMPVVSTTEKGNFYEVTPMELGNTANLWAKFQEGTEPVYIALKSFGKYKSFFPKGAPKEEKKDKKKNDDKSAKPQHLSESQKESALLVVSDVDFLADTYSFKRSFLGMAPANDNSKFLLNALEALSGNSDLLSVRSKGAIDRGFDVIDEIEFAAEEATKQKVAQINASISNFQKELDMLGKSATQENLSLLQNEGVRKKKQLLKKMAALKKELRAVKREGREQIENLGKWLQLINTLGMPLLIFAFGFYFNRKRKNRYLEKITVQSQIKPTLVQGEQA